MLTVLSREAVAIRFCSVKLQQKERWVGKENQRGMRWGGEGDEEGGLISAKKR
jgi:hypothetical protein